MASIVTCLYTVNREGVAPASALEALMSTGNAPADLGLLLAIGGNVESDVVGTSTGIVTRTIVVDLTRGIFIAAQANGTPYNWRGSIVSTSDADSATGDGAQTVEISYQDKDGNPFTEEVTMNGTMPVVLGATHGHALIVDIVPLTFGDVGGTIGTLRITTTIDGTIGPVGSRPEVDSPPKPGFLIATEGPSFYVNGTSSTDDDVIASFFSGWMTGVLGVATGSPVVESNPVAS